jgi:hypothetical protein
MLYETAARPAALLDVEDPGLANRRAKVRRKADAAGIIVGQAGTAPAAPQRAHSRRRGRNRDADADDPPGSHVGAVAGPVRASERPGALQRHQGGRDPARRR